MPADHAPDDLAAVRVAVVTESLARVLDLDPGVLRSDTALRTFDVGPVDLVAWADEIDASRSTPAGWSFAVDDARLRDATPMTVADLVDFVTVVVAHPEPLPLP